MPLARWVGACVCDVRTRVLLVYAGRYLGEVIDADECQRRMKEKADLYTGPGCAVCGGHHAADKVLLCDGSFLFVVLVVLVVAAVPAAATVVAAAFVLCCC